MSKTVYSITGDDGVVYGDNFLDADLAEAERINIMTSLGDEAMVTLSVTSRTVDDNERVLGAV